MIDQRIVGAIVAGDISGYRLTADDARLLVGQRVATPVHHLLQQHPSAADDQATEILNRAASRANMHSMLQVRTSNEITRLLDGAGIHTLVYKGVTLAVTQTGSWRGRESVDVDIIIDPTDVERAHAALVANGLHRFDDKPRAPSAVYRYHDIEMAYLGLPTIVDLHWRLESPGYLDIPFRSLWAGRRHLAGTGLNVSTLGETETLLVSAVHGTRERWCSLRQMLDASLPLSGMSADKWHQLVHAANDSGASKSLAVALAVAEACAVSDLPAIPGEWARSVANMLLTRWSTRALSDTPTAARSPIDALKRRLLRWNLAGEPTAALDSLARATVRQVLHKRSWTLGQRPPARKS